jgi:hypothetical protein
MGRFLFALALTVSSAAVDAAFAKGGVVHLFVTRTPSASQLPPASEFLAGCGHGRYRDRVTQKWPTLEDRAAWIVSNAASAGQAEACPDRNRRNVVLSD